MKVVLFVSMCALHFLACATTPNQEKTVGVGRSGSCLHQVDGVPAICADYQNFPEANGFALDTMCVKQGGQWLPTSCNIPKGKVGCRQQVESGSQTTWYLDASWYEDGEPPCQAGTTLVRN